MLIEDLAATLALKNILSKSIATRSAISKFVFGQKYVNFSPWNDNITEPF